MDILNAIILGIIQGLTEFLPVSSSGHLEIAEFFIESDGSLLMTVVLHFATALSTMIIFWKDIKEIIFGLIRFKNNKAFAFSLKILISMIPAVFVGLLFEKQVEMLFNNKLTLVGFMLIATSVLLFIADKIKPRATSKDLNLSNSLLIGIAQAIAILPGMSRSGSTISTAIFLGINKEKAARFSFLMAIPIIFGKMSKDILSGEVIYNSVPLLPLTIGFISAFITGIIACKWMVKLVKNSQLKYFAYYCLLIGVIIIITNMYS